MSLESVQRTCSETRACHSPGGSTPSSFCDRVSPPDLPLLATTRTTSHGAAPAFSPARVGEAAATQARARAGPGQIARTASLLIKAPYWADGCGLTTVIVKVAHELVRACTQVGVACDTGEIATMYDMGMPPDVAIVHDYTACSIDIYLWRAVDAAIRNARVERERRRTQRMMLGAMACEPEGEDDTTEVVNRTTRMRMRVSFH